MRRDFAGTVGNKDRTDFAMYSRNPRRSVVSVASVKSECDSVNFQSKNGLHFT